MPLNNRLVSTAKAGGSYLKRVDKRGLVDHYEMLAAINRFGSVGDVHD
jgi:hypothetical protein